MPDDVAATEPYVALASNLAALASEARLALLHVLRTPKAIHEIRVAPSAERAGESPDRAMSRQAVTRQLDLLLEAGLVHRARSPGPGSAARGDLFVLNHERLFALVDEVHSLAKLRPVVTSGSLMGETVDQAGEGEVRMPPRPRLVLAYGRDDGVAFGLQGTGGAGWRIGRAPDCEVRLDYDPYLSAEHAVVRRAGAAFELLDDGSRNGTWLNWQRLTKGLASPLQNGDLLVAGRSVLVFQG